VKDCVAIGGGSFMILILRAFADMPCFGDALFERKAMCLLT
jgi:hypothetical protein